MDNDYDAGVKAGLSAAAVFLEMEAEETDALIATMKSGLALAIVADKARMLREWAATVRTIKVTRGRR